jgi:hypothetical protein
MPLDSERVKHEYFHLATQYYTAARYSARAALTPVCGNLFHHAIELYMKGALSEHMSTKKLKGLRHKLRNTWARFKVEFPDASLERFDAPIRALDEFESIRYPEKLVGEGAVCVFTFERFDAARMASYSPGSAPSYVLMITELDALVGLIFEKAQLNRAAFFFNNQHARRYLEEAMEFRW